MKTRLSLFVLFVLLSLCTIITHAQTITALHMFTGGPDGGNPANGPTLDNNGNLYGGTLRGGSSGAGVAYKVKVTDQIFSSLFAFNIADGQSSGSTIVIQQGVLYGTTVIGGAGSEGVIFKLQPPDTFCRAITCLWMESAIYNFPDQGPGGYAPEYNNIVFDAEGNIWGTAFLGGDYGYGTLFELTANGGGGFTYSDVYSFGAGSGGQYPTGGPVFDATGNVYVPTGAGGANGGGTISKLTNTHGTWTETVLYSIGNVGDGASGTLALDSAGDIFVAAPRYNNYGGAVWELQANGQQRILHSFTGGGPGPLSGLTMDGAGNLYGATYGDGTYGSGNVFELSAGSYNYTDLFDFQGGVGAGINPVGQLAIDNNGNLYGTSLYGGTYGYGAVWKLTLQ